MEDRVSFGNVVYLDMRTATEASVAGIARIGNVVNLIHSPQTAGLIGRLNIGNVVNRIEAPAGAKVHQGELVLGRHSFAEVAEPLTLVVLGQVVVEPDVTPEDVEGRLDKIWLAGRLLCPEHLAGALEAKTEHLGGPLYVYPSGAKLVVGKLKLDERYLESLEDGTELVVSGKLDASQVVPDGLLGRKIAKIHLVGRVVCRRENAETLLARLERKSGTGRVTVIPAGHAVVQRALTLNTAVLEALTERKLYCTELVVIEEDVSPETLDKHLEALVAKQLVVCPSALGTVLLGKVDVLETDIILYEGQLVLVKDERKLSPAFFEGLEDRATLVVLGKLRIAADVEPKVLSERLLRVHNYGFILGTRDQIAVLQLLPGAREGTMKEDDVGGESSAGDGFEIGNMVNLKL